MPTSRPMWRREVATSTSPVAIYLPSGVSELKVYCVESHLVAFGNDYAPPSTTLADHVFTIETLGAPTGGVFRLRFDSSNENSANIGFNSSAANIVTAINALANINSGDFAGAGGPLPTPVTLTAAQVYADTNLSKMLYLSPSGNTLSGGVNPSVQVRDTTVGGVSPYVFCEAEQTEIIPIHNLNRATLPGARYVYLAAVASTGTVRLSGYRQV